MRTDRKHVVRRVVEVLAAVAGIALVAAGCSSTQGKSASGPGSSGTKSGSAKPAAVTIDLTPAGCTPKPAKVAAGAIDFTVANKDASKVSEAELRTSDLSKILGEQENLSPGLSGGFSLTVSPGSYVINCPGATRQHWTFTVTGQQSGSDWQDVPQLSSAVTAYGNYVDANVTNLVTSTQTFCKAIDAGNLGQSKILYAKARIYYERIEPVAEVWGGLDTQIDGRWENPVTVKSQFVGFHRIEQLLWQAKTLAGTPKLCAGLLKNETQLKGLVYSAQYNPLEMASGSTDLINEAATSKISGEEERYSQTDLPDFQANVDGAMAVVSLLTPYLQHKDPSLLTQIRRRDNAVKVQLAKFKVSPGYDDTGYVDYSTVHTAQRRQLSAAVNALAEILSKLSLQVGS
jgi:iron uptake system component EfeO